MTVYLMMETGRTTPADGPRLVAGILHLHRGGRIAPEVLPPTLAVEPRWATDLGCGVFSPPPRVVR